MPQTLNFKALSTKKTAALNLLFGRLSLKAGLVTLLGTVLTVAGRRAMAV